MNEPTNQPATPDTPCPGAMPLAGVSDALTPEEEAFLLQEGDVCESVRQAVDHFCRFGYPLHAQTLAAIDASTTRFVVPWSTIREQYIPEWVRQHLLGGEDDRSIPVTCARVWIILTWT